MKKYLTILLSLIYIGILSGQTLKVAILDFENTSGKQEYDAHGKAISSMLITDLANNIHPKKVDFFERTQLNKLLDEQNLQKNKSFDTNTAVEFGKLSGVNYVFIGSVFIMDGTCNFSSKLVDVQTSKILLAKDVSGKIETWLLLKSQLSEAIASQLNNPITLDPSYKDQSTSLATINQYGKILATMDGGDVEKAEQMRSLFEESNPDFKYYADIKEEIEELKKQVAKNTADIEVLNKAGGRVVNASTPMELMNNLTNPNTDYLNRKIELEKLLVFPLDSIKYIYGKSMSLASFNSYPAAMLGYTKTCKDLDYFIEDLIFLISLNNKVEVNKESLFYFIQCKQDYFTGDISRTFPDLILEYKKMGILYKPSNYSEQFEELIEVCEQGKKKKIIDELLLQSKLLISSGKK